MLGSHASKRGVAIHTFSAQQVEDFCQVRSCKVHLVRGITCWLLMAAIHAFSAKQVEEFCQMCACRDSFAVQPTCAAHLFATATP